MQPAIWNRSATLLAALTVFSAGLTPLAAWADASANLTQTQVRALKSVGIAIALPGYVPPGFKLTKLKTTPAKPSGRPSYDLLYRNASGSCFYISGSVAGVGGPEASYSFPVTTQLFGKTSINIGATFGPGPYDQKPSAQQLNSPQSEIWSFSTIKGVIYGIGTQEKRDGCGVNRRITPLEIEKIMQSLAWL